MSPVLVDEDVGMDGMKGAGEKSRQFGRYFQKIAEKYECEFLDLARHTEPSKIDGCHLDPDSHAKIAKILAEKI